MDIVSRYFNYKTNKLNANSILIEKILLYISPLFLIILIKYPLFNIFLVILIFYKKKIIIFILLFIWYLIFGLIHAINFNIFDINIFIDSNIGRFIGYITFFAPAGIGTREAFLYSQYSDKIEINLIIIYLTNIRVLNIFVDLFFSAISSYFLNQNEKSN